MKMILRTSTSGNGPGRNGSIFVTFRSLRNVYFVTKPTGPDSESSHTIAYLKSDMNLLIFNQESTQMNWKLVGLNRKKIPLCLRICPECPVVPCWPPLGTAKYSHGIRTNVGTSLDHNICELLIEIRIAVTNKVSSSATPFYFKRILYTLNMTFLIGEFVSIVFSCQIDKITQTHLWMSQCVRNVPR